MERRLFSRIGKEFAIPDLTRIQRQSYEEFLQADVAMNKRKNVGLESAIREVFPIENERGDIRLEYLGYDLGNPRYDPEECRQLRLTYGMPFRIRARLHKGGEVLEEDVYMGEVPIMLGGGEFIINGAERVVVSQLHRSPGVEIGRAHV